MAIEVVTPDDLLGPLNDVEAKNAPKVLYLEGDRDLLTNGARISVVGSRKPSPEGLKRARFLAKALVDHSIMVVSGLAEGIDTVAHETAIEAGGKTIAVLGTPLSAAYPAKNGPLLAHIKHEHLAVSQFPEGAPTLRKSS